MYCDRDCTPKTTEIKLESKPILQGVIQKVLLDRGGASPNLGIIYYMYS